jgi:ribosomal protein S18 acetylase RimI-like enzyme
LKEIIDLSFPRFFRFFANHSISDPNEPVLVSEVDGNVVGFAKLIEFHVGSIKYGCILWLAVHPTQRRRGFAAALVKAGVEYLVQDDTREVFASVQRHNKASLATFRKEGFMQVGLVGLWRHFGWHVFSFYRDIWYALGEIVLVKHY